MLPTQPHLIERRSSDYVRNGTTTLFAALEIATGKVTAACRPRHRRQEFLSFLRQIARAYPGRELLLPLLVLQVSRGHCSAGRSGAFRTISRARGYVLLSALLMQMLGFVVQACSRWGIRRCRTVRPGILSRNLPSMGAVERSKSS